MCYKNKFNATLDATNQKLGIDLIARYCRGEILFYYDLICLFVDYLFWQKAVLYGCQKYNIGYYNLRVGIYGPGMGNFWKILSICLY